MKKTITVVTGGHGGMGKAICKELGTDSAIVLAGEAENEESEFFRAGYINSVDILADGGQNVGIFVPQI